MTKDHILNSSYYYYRRMRWLFYYLNGKSARDSIVFKPIFIVGHQGNGATIVSRVVRRCDRVVTLSGNSKYFTGADEMQSAMGLLLDYRLTGLLHKTPKSNKLGRRRGWAYACNELLPFYQYDESDFSLSVRTTLMNAIKTAIVSNRPNRKGDYRFLDKSQSYALKIPLIRRALHDSNPLFVGIVRNPLAVCWRAAYLKTGLSKERFSIREKLKIATEHWNNSANAMLEQEGSQDFILLKIEDILSDFELHIKTIFEFVDLPFKSDYLPNANDKMPFGSKRKERWFPVKKEINSKYILDLPEDVRDYILDKCYDNIQRLGYLP